MLKHGWQKLLLSTTVVGVGVVIMLGTWIHGQQVREAELQSKLDTLQQHLYRGESRATLEGQLGSTIPRPENMSTGTASYEKGVRRWYDRSTFYEYGAETAIGVVVYYDAHDRVVFWNPYNKPAVFDP